MARYPDFLGIGAEKSGTSWLHRNLRYNETLFLPPQKEVHYFNATHSAEVDRATRIVSFYNQFTEMIRQKTVTVEELQSLSHWALGDGRTDEWYAELFAPAGIRLAGEVTPEYSILPIERIKHIYSLMPEVKIIFLMREPISRTWSSYRMLVNDGKREFSEKDAMEMTKDAYLLSKANYMQIIENWESVFPRENIFYGFYEDIVERPVELLTDITRFIGSDIFNERHLQAADRIVYPGVPIEIPKKVEKKLAEIYIPMLEKLAERFEAPCRSWLEKAYAIRDA